MCRPRGSNGGTGASVVTAGLATISGNRVDQTVDAGIQIGWPVIPVGGYYPNGVTITHNKITNANTSNKVGIGAITILQNNIYGVNIGNNDISTSFNGLALQIAGWQNSPDTKTINNNNIYNLTAGSYGATHIAGIAPNGLFGTGDNLLLYNLTNNYWGSASGPTYATNSGGTGVGLKKDANVLGGGTYSLNDFSFTPFLTSPTTVNSVVACASLPTASNTVALTSAASTRTQTVCEGASIAPITYSTSGATGATVTGLPAGVTGTWSGNVVTITGAPTTAAGAATYTVTLTGGCGALTQTGTVAVTALSPTLAATAGGASVCESNTVAVAGSTYTNSASCNRIARVLPSGATPVSGVINSCVKIDAAVTTYSGAPYVQRHYDIEPATGAATATGTITLYFTQAEMTSFNTASPTSAPLMTGPSDATGKANLIITQFHGTGTAPGNYTGTTEYINPNDANIVWNASTSLWEVTFDVNGFSGFYASSITILPINLLVFTGKNNGVNNQLQWATGIETEAQSFEIERSIDAINFVKVGTVMAQPRANVNNNYTYDDIISNMGSKKFQYRLKMKDITGSFKYSAVLKINLANSGFFVEANPNPFKNIVNIMIETAQSAKVRFQLSDINGKIVKDVSNYVQKGSSVIQLNELHSLPNGMYMLNVTSVNEKQTIKLVKQ